MSIKFTNNATTTLASGINSSATSLTVQTGAGALFPSLAGADIFYVTLANVAGTIEIVQVTARTSDTFTIVRGQDNTAAVSWSTGDKVELRPVAVGMTAMAQTANNLSDLASAATARTNLGLGSIATLAAPSGTVVGTTDTQALTNKTIEAGTFTNGYTEEVNTANTSTAYTIDLANGSLHLLTLTGNCTYTFPTVASGKSFTLLQFQDGTGSRTVTWPASVKWPGGTAPTITATASKMDKFVFTANGSYWYGSVAGQNF